MAEEGESVSLILAEVVELTGVLRLLRWKSPAQMCQES